MKGLISLLLRERVGAYVGRHVLRQMLNRVIGTIVFYAVLAVLALAALAFLYVLIDRWLAAEFDQESAAAILVGGNLVLIALALLGRRLSRPGSGRSSVIGLSKPDLDAGIALGQRLAKELRKAAPGMALAAAVIGLAIGARPEVLQLLRRRPRASNDQRQSKK